MFSNDYNNNNVLYFAPKIGTYKIEHSETLPHMQTHAHKKAIHITIILTVIRDPDPAAVAVLHGHV